MKETTKSKIEDLLGDLAMRIAQDGDEGMFWNVLDTIVELRGEKASDVPPKPVVDNKNMLVLVGCQWRPMPRSTYLAIADHLANRRKIQAIKLLREHYGTDDYSGRAVISLKAAKHAVEDCENWRVPEKHFIPDKCDFCQNVNKHPAKKREDEAITRAAEAAARREAKFEVDGWFGDSSRCVNCGADVLHKGDTLCSLCRTRGV